METFTFSFMKYYWVFLQQFAIQQQTSKLSPNKIGQLRQI